jgi:hypothetical protein
MEEYGPIMPVEEPPVPAMGTEGLLLFYGFKVYNAIYSMFYRL